MNFGNFSPANFANCLGGKGSNLRVNSLNKNESCDNHNFLMISKSTRVPEIQMINKYYGLIPKKFTINSRNTDQSSKFSTKLREKSAYSFDSRNDSRKNGTRALRPDSNSFHSPSNVAANDDEEEYTDLQSKSRPAQYNNGGEQRNNGSKAEVASSTNNRRGSHSHTTSQVEIVARKMPVEKYKRWKRAKSMSLMDNNANMNSSSSEKDSRNSQRVIKIDLTNMRWEESYQSKTNVEARSRSGGDDDGNSINNLDGRPPSTDCAQHNNIDYSSEVQNENSTKAKSFSLLISNNDSNNLNSSANGSVTSGAFPRRSTLRKTISFDEQLLQSTLLPESTQHTSVTKTDSDNVRIRRPMTAVPRAAQSSVRVSAWTNRAGQTTVDRRAKLQKSNSIQSDRDHSSSIDLFGQGESDNEQEPSADFPSWAYRESRKTLHVQALPEVSTMVSTISPPADEEIQSEIEKVALMLNNLQNQQYFINQPPTKVDLAAPKEIPIQPSTAAPSIVFSNPQDPNNPTTTNDTLKTEDDIGKNTDCRLEQEKSANKEIEDVNKRVPRRPFKKSVSISCESELYSTGVGGAGSLSSRNDPTINSANGKSCRPKTANSARNISRSSSVVASSRSLSTTAIGKLSSQNVSQLTSEKTNSTDQSQGLKNRKILIKKALIEINQASTSFGKRVGTMGRPKTAPAAEKKPPSTNTNLTQPFKAAARSPASYLGKVTLKKVGILAQKMETTAAGKVEEEDNEGKTSDQSSPEPKHRTLQRQSFSLDEGMLLGFSSRDLQEDIKDAELSFLSSKKREECLKIYEKMMKTGCVIKLDTIFRGMMTPSEYRTFIKAAENAARETAVDEEATESSEKDADSSILESSQKIEEAID